MVDLPVDAVLPRLLKTFEDHTRAVLQAPPGAGKTTRVPLALRSAPWLGGGKIVMLEPRRLAARTAARFMAAQLGEEVGETVGYRVRLDSRVGPKTRIEVVTEGVLTRMLQDDPSLDGVAVVIFDEFHERSLQADLGLALCLESQAALREDLRLLVMSATLAGDEVARFLGDAPLIRSEGRSFPVDVRYLAAARGRTSQRVSPVDAVVPAVCHALAEEPGSLLVFLPGVAEIKRVEARLREAALGDDLIIAPLYGHLSQQAQEQAIAPAPAGLRKVVLATNIAETSLTIEGIRIVIDSGLARRPRFEPRTGMSHLDTVTISRASAEQRRGRAGRLEAGVCYRLWPEGRHLVAQTPAEIVEADLAPLLLELAQWGVGEPAELAWLDPPPEAAVAQARTLLRQLGALDQQNRITAHGRRMVGLALHPRLAHMVLKGVELGLGALACDLAALLSERDPLRHSPMREPDIHGRLLALLGQRREGVDKGAVQRAREAARQWRRQLGVEGRTDQHDLDQAGLLLAFAYPERIACRRSGAKGRYLLANGRGAAFAQPCALAGAEFLAVAQLAGGEQEGRIELAAQLEPDVLGAHFSDQIETEAFIRWSEAEEAVVMRRQRRLGALVLADEGLRDADPAAIQAAMIEGIRRLGLAALPWDKSSRQWLARLRFLHRLDPQGWPDVSDEQLLARLEQWLGPYLDGVSRRAQLARIDLAAALRGLLDWPRQRRLDEWAPTHLKVPSGSAIALDYDNDPPILAVRLQEMFGAVDTPTIAGGRVKVLLHLLSPARRPLQVTQDLAGFWGGSYGEVKREMKGRYPRHYWPDDPTRAEPTRRAKPRK